MNISVNTKVKFTEDEFKKVFGKHFNQYPEKIRGKKIKELFAKLYPKVKNEPKKSSSKPESDKPIGVNRKSDSKE